MGVGGWVFLCVISTLGSTFCKSQSVAWTPYRLLLNADFIVWDVRWLLL
jgi:hypothetical protein